MRPSADFDLEPYYPLIARRRACRIATLIAAYSAGHEGTLTAFSLDDILEHTGQMSRAEVRDAVRMLVAKELLTPRRCRRVSLTVAGVEQVESALMVPQALWDGMGSFQAALRAGIQVTPPLVVGE